MPPYYEHSFPSRIVADVEQDDARVERLKFHLQTGDYFPLLATIFGFVEESVEECIAGEEVVHVETDIVKNIRQDLMYLHQHYTIVPRDSFRDTIS